MDMLLDVLVAGLLHVLVIPVLLLLATPIILLVAAFRSGSFVPNVQRTYREGYAYLARLF